METFDIRNRIEEIMNEKGMSRDELAKAIGCSRRAVYYWLNRQRSFNEDWLLNVCEALGVTPNEFFKVEKEAKTELPKGGKEARTDCLEKLCRMDNDTIRRKLEFIRKTELLMELVLKFRDTDFQEQWEELFGEESGSDA